MFAHASGQWAKKIRGRLVYFGSWRTDPKGFEAKAVFDYEWPYLKDGKEPPDEEPSDAACNLQNLTDRFLASKQPLVDSGERSPRLLRDYRRTCDDLLNNFGAKREVESLTPLDFGKYRAKLSKRLGVISLRNEINRVRIVFNYGSKNGLIKLPLKELFGSEFEKPNAKTIRRDRNTAGPKLFERDEIVRILGACDSQLKAMVLLGINGGLGNTDVSDLHESRIDFTTGWLDYPRPKTEIPRRIPLWPETLQALQDWLPQRPKSSDSADSGLVFLTVKGNRWARVNQTEDGRYTAIDALSARFKKLLRSLDINGRRSLGFYCLRHCFETYAGESRDQVAVDAIMGHVDPSMGANYRHRISDERLQAAVNVVRDWLFADQTEGVRNE